MSKRVVPILLAVAVCLILGAAGLRALGTKATAPPPPARTELEGPKPEPQPAVRIPVLLYHHLQPGAGGDNGAVISVEEFTAQMEWLRQRGYTAISIDDLEGWLRGETRLPLRSVLITFDDGYDSVYQYAYPVLQREGLKAVVFTVTSTVGRVIAGKDHLSWEQMKEMEGSGLLDIQGHGHDGHRTVERGPVLMVWSTEEIRSDLETMNRLLVLHGLQPATAFAYPYGAYDAEVIEVLKEVGVRLAFTTQRGYVSKDADPYALSRIIIFPGTGLCEFATLVDPESGGTDPVCPDPAA